MLAAGLRFEYVTIPNLTEDLTMGNMSPTYQKTWYANSSAESKAKKSAYRLCRKHNLRDTLNKYKTGKGCCRCSERDPVCLDFHHTSRNKEVNISEVTTRGWGLGRIMSEVQKCVVICSNCHRKLHRDELEAKVGLEPTTF